MWMSWMKWTGLIVVLLAGLNGAWGEETPTTAPATPAEPMRPQVVIRVQCDNDDWGEFTVELYPDVAPRTVENFLRYVDEGYYNDTIFHRVLPGFIIQGGGYTSATREKSGGLHPPIPNEARKENALKNERGTLAMARGSDPHSAQAQFFINIKDNPGLDPEYEGHDGWGYCVFGKVVDSLNVVDRMRSVGVRTNLRMGRERSLPIRELHMHIERVKENAPSAAPVRSTEPPPGVRPGQPTTKPAGQTPPTPPKPESEDQPKTKPEPERQVERDGVSTPVKE